MHGLDCVNEAIIHTRNENHPALEAHFADGVVFGTSNRISYASRKRTIRARAQWLGWTGGAVPARPFSMHITLDQDPLLGSGVMPTTLHMTL